MEAEPEQALPALALGDLDLVLADEWQPQPRSLPEGVVRHELPGDPVRLVLPAGHPAAERHPEAVPLAELAGEPWATGDGRHGLGGDDARAPAARSAASTPTCATGRPARRSRSRSWRAAWR